jgi:hypothetical protein
VDLGVRLGISERRVSAARATKRDIEALEPHATVPPVRVASRQARQFLERNARHTSCSTSHHLGQPTKGKPMKNDDSKKTQPVEGEGSYTATGRYNQHLGDAIDSGDVEAAADAARRALEGPERAELERAERQGKAGPARKPPPAKTGVQSK